MWRRLWRSLGLAVDRLLPVCYKPPAPPRDELMPDVCSVVAIPHDGKRTLTEPDKELVVDATCFVVDFVSESLPVQVVSADMKPLLPRSASALAVRRVGRSYEYVGSFDLLTRIRALRTNTWKKYHGQEMVIDVKITGSSRPLGVNSPTVLGYLQHGQSVIREAQRSPDCRVGKATVVAYLIRRPPYRKYGGGWHGGAWAFLAFEVDRLLDWNPENNRAPQRIVTWGAHVIEGNQDDPDALPRPPAPVRPPRRDRWAELLQQSTAGFVTLPAFVDKFDMKGARSMKSAAGTVSKRLRDEGCLLADQPNGVGRPSKAARVIDLKRCYGPPRGTYQ